MTEFVRGMSYALHDLEVAHRVETPDGLKKGFISARGTNQALNAIVIMVEWLSGGEPEKTYPYREAFNVRLDTLVSKNDKAYIWMNYAGLLREAHNTGPSCAWTWLGASWQRVNSCGRGRCSCQPPSTEGTHMLELSTSAEELPLTYDTIDRINEANRQLAKGAQEEELEEQEPKPKRRRRIRRD